MRVGRHWKKMARKLSDSEASWLWGKCDGNSIYAGFKEAYTLIDVMRQRVEERALFVVEKARQRGEKARRTWHSCRDSACAICKGNGAEHFHLSVEGKKDVNLEEWLANYLSPEEILDFVALIRNRENLLVLLTYQTILLTNLGLLEG